jgi:hypothetical protein
VANITVKGSGPLYTNNTGITHFGANYFIPYLRGNGLLFTDKNLFISAVNNNAIDLRTGSDLSSATSKFRINGDGQLNIGIAPTTNNSVVSVLGRTTLGDIVSVDKSSIGGGGTTPTFQAVLTVGNLSETATPFTPHFILRQGAIDVAYTTTGIIFDNDQTSTLQSFYGRTNMSLSSSVSNRTFFVNLDDGLNLQTNAAGGKVQIKTTNVLNDVNLEMPPTSGTFLCVSTNVTAPASSFAPGLTNEVRYVGSYLYFYTGTQWLRFLGTAF